jgi:hypothetical protein
MQINLLSSWLLGGRPDRQPDWVNLSLYLIHTEHIFPGGKWVGTTHIND